MKKVIIVGGGISGLTAAVYLARDGHKVLLFEKNREFGGLVSSIEHNGFTFEAGVRALVNAGIIKPMLNDLGINIELIPNKVSIGIEDKIIHFEGATDVDKYGEMLMEVYPENKNEISNLVSKMKKVTGYVANMYKIDNPVFHDLKKEKEFLLKKLLPWLPKFLLTLRKINSLQEPVEQYVARYITDSPPRDIITQHFFKATPAFFALGYYAIYSAYFYPRGGVGKLAEAIKDKALELQAELKPNTTIKSVNPAEQFVVDENGTQYNYDYLLWAADLPTFYRIVETDNLPLKVKKRIAIINEQIKKAKSSESVFSLYLEVNMPLQY
ncbi:MAG: NAD(P)/FAD-dependent oxidoreductase, partial [Bacteroidetes bacterium]